MKSSQYIHFFRSTPLLLILACLLYSSQSKSQVAVLPWGGDASSETGSVSYSLGQVADEHYSSENGYCNEGVQQPFRPDSTTAYFDVASGMDFYIYPNPFREEVSVYSKDVLEFEIEYSIMDLAGRLLAAGVIYTIPHAIQLPLWPDGMYIMILRKDQVFIDAIKLIKAE